MSTRDYKLFRPGGYYHLYNRGDNREALFHDEWDYVQFLKRFKLALGLAVDPKLKIRAFPDDSFTLLAYCLMDNHFHLLIKQETELPVGELVRKVGTSYAKYFNARYKRVGNIFQDVFKAKDVGNDEYITYLTAYIHLNPLEPFEYQYSSLPEYLGRRNGTLCDPGFVLGLFGGDRERYRKFLENYSYRDHQKIEHLGFDED